MRVGPLPQTIHIIFLTHFSVASIAQKSISGIGFDTLASKNTTLKKIFVNSIQGEFNRNSAHPINTLSRAEILKSGQNTIIESLSQKPGMDIISTGGIGKPVIRGLSFNKVALYSMGTKIESQQWDDDHDVGISEAGIEKAEIVLGPAAVIYGADAVGGSIIFIDEKNSPPGKTLGNINLGLYSNTRGINIGAGIKHSFSSGDYLNAFFNGQSHMDYRQGRQKVDPANPFAINSRYNNISGKLRTGLVRKWGSSRICYSYLRSLSGLVVGEDENSILIVQGKAFNSNERKLNAPYFDVTTQVISSENTLLSGKGKFYLNVSYQSNKRDEYIIGEGADHQRHTLGLLLNTFNYESRFTSSEERHAGITIGIQGFAQLNKNYGAVIATPDAMINNIGMYGLIHLNYGKWKFQTGLRLDTRNISVAKPTRDYEDETTLDSLEKEALRMIGLKRNVSDFNNHYFPVNFSAEAVYHCSTKLTCKANISTGFTAPNFAELATFWKHEGTSRFEIGNPNLKPQKNIEGDIYI